MILITISLVFIITSARSIFFFHLLYFYRVVLLTLLIIDDIDPLFGLGFSPHVDLTNRLGVITVPIIEVVGPVVASRVFEASS